MEKGATKFWQGLPPRSDNALKKLFLPGEGLPYFFYPYFLWLPLATNIYYRK